MALEESGVDYIDDLVITDPTNGEDPTDGAGHIRSIKKAVKQSFPAVDGAVTSTDTELNYLDGSTPGSAVASKALVVDASGDIDALKTVTIDTELTVAESPFAVSSDGGFHTSAIVTAIQGDGRTSTAPPAGGTLRVMPEAAVVGIVVKGDTSQSQDLQQWLDSAGTTVASIAADGGLVLPNIPTSDPGVAGEVWSDTGTLKISAG